MNDKMTFCKVSGFSLTEVVGTQVIIASDIKLANYDKMLQLNESAAYLYSSIPDDSPITLDELAHILVTRYEIPFEQAKNDALAAAREWTELGILSAL